MIKFKFHRFVGHFVREPRGVYLKEYPALERTSINSRFLTSNVARNSRGYILAGAVAPPSMVCACLRAPLNVLLRA